MYYESSDFLETADSDTLKQIARTRELTRDKAGAVEIRA